MTDPPSNTILRASPAQKSPRHRGVAGRLFKAGRFSLSVWMKLHRTLLASLAGLLAAAILVVAVVSFRMDVTSNPASKAPDVAFQNGADYTGINVAGFATVTLGASGTSATLALSGIAGVAQTSLANILKLSDGSATVPYTVSLARSAAPNAAITSFQVTVKNGASTLLTWDAVASATSSSFTLPVSTSLDISILVVVADGTAAGSLGSFAMQFTLAP